MNNGGAQRKGTATQRAEQTTNNSHPQRPPAPAPLCATQDTTQLVNLQRPSHRLCARPPTSCPFPQRRRRRSPPAPLRLFKLDASLQARHRGRRVASSVLRRIQARVPLGNELAKVAVAALGQLGEGRRR